MALTCITVCLVGMLILRHDCKGTLGHHTFWDGNHALAFDDAFGFSYATLVEF